MMNDCDYIEVLERALAESRAECERLREWADGPNGVKWYIAQEAKQKARADRLVEGLREIVRRMPDKAGPGWIAKTIAQEILTAAQQESQP